MAVQCSCKLAARNLVMLANFRPSKVILKAIVWMRSCCQVLFTSLKQHFSEVLANFLLLWQISPAHTYDRRNKHNFIYWGRMQIICVQVWNVMTLKDIRFETSLLRLRFLWSHWDKLFVLVVIWLSLNWTSHYFDFSNSYYLLLQSLFGKMWKTV